MKEIETPFNKTPIIHSGDVRIKGAVSRNSAPLGNYKMPVCVTFAISQLIYH